MRTKTNIRDNWPDLEKFTSAGAKLANLYVYISPRKSLTFNSGFIHRAKKEIDNATHLVFSYSRSKNAIVFEFTDDNEDPGAFKITKGANYSVNAVSFFNYYGIDAQKAQGKYIPKLENIPKRGNCWVIYLNQKVGEK